MRTRIVVVILVVGLVLAGGTYIVLRPDYEAAMADYAALMRLDAGTDVRPR
ncbi:MAG: hypothetical protein Q8L48_31635 [Archangium sp.]|nr:hypothetical protein [Archangium sp.]